MKKFAFTLICVLVSSIALLAQDEGAVVTRERIDKDKQIYLQLGGSFTTLKNKGDYGAGGSFEFGFQKRMNRVISLGASLGFVGFAYDPTFNQVLGNDGYPNNFFYDSELDGSGGYLVDLEGGDISITTLALNLKLNVIPVKDNSVISVYAFAKPFVANATRSEISGTAYAYEFSAIDNSFIENPDFDEVWGPDDFDALKEKSVVTGGVNLGFGVEFFPARRFSFFIQVDAGYTFPINIVSFSAYDRTLASYVDERFPTSDEAFFTGSAALGLAVNF